MPKAETTQGVITLDMTKQPTLPEDYNKFKAAAQALEIRDDESFKIAAEMVKRAGDWERSVEAFFDKGKKAAFAAHRWFTGTISGLVAPYDVRPILEPRMKAYLRKKDDERRAEELRQARLREEEERKAREEAERIQREADARAAEFRRAGQMAAAKEAVAVAAAKAEEVQQAVDIGTIVPDETPKVDGVGSARPWTGRVTDPMRVIKAVAAGTTPLMFSIPKHGGAGAMEDVPLLVVNERVVKYLGKRTRRADIGIPGATGEVDISLRFSKSDPGPPEPQGVYRREEDQEAW